MLYDLIIVGGGPAGATAGIYAGRQKLKTLLVTKAFGGQMAKNTVDIKNYPGFESISGLDLLQKFEHHLKQYEIDIEHEEVKEIKKTGKHFIVTLKGAKKLEGKAVIIASGADPRSLNLKGEQEFIGRGLSYCVHCDGPLFFDKTVAVIGGGNSGLEAALFLSSVAKKIYILEYGEALKADRENQEKIKNIKKIEIITNVALKEIKGKQFVNEIVYQDRKTKKDVVLPLEGIVVEIGYQPATAFVKNLADFTEKQEIKTDMETFQTKTPGLFVAGDAKAGKYKQIVIAAGEGAKAALSAFQYLKNEKLI